MCSDILAQSLCVLQSFWFGKSQFVSPIEVVLMIAWRNVYVIMPDILIASAFVVLSCRNAIAAIDHFQRERNSSGYRLKRLGIDYRQVVQVLKVLIGYE